MARHCPRGKRLVCGLTDVEIAKASGLSVPTVRRIASLKSWRTLKIDVAHRFAKACGHDLLRPRRSLQYLTSWVNRGIGFKHLSHWDYKRLKARL